LFVVTAADLRRTLRGESQAMRYAAARRAGVNDGSAMRARLSSIMPSSPPGAPDPEVAIWYHGVPAVA